MHCRVAFALTWCVYMLFSGLPCFSLPRGLTSRLPRRAWGVGGASEVLRRKPGPDRRTILHFLPGPSQVAYGRSLPSRDGACRAVLASFSTSVATAAKWAQGVYERQSLLVLTAATLVALAGLHQLAHSACGHCCQSHNALRSLGDAAATGLAGSSGFVAWMSEPGCPDHTFGGLCVWSNIFFAALAPVFWLKRRFCEVTLVGLVAVASTVYHSLQIHPALGPLHTWTKVACVSDVTLAVTFAVVLAARYPRSRLRALPWLLGAMVCFIVPCLLPHGQAAEVGYSFLHSAWHGFSALAAYAMVGPIGESMKPAAVRKGLAAAASPVALA